MIVSAIVAWEVGVQVEVVLEAAPEGLAEQAHALVAVEALPAWEVSVAVVAAAAAVLVAAAAVVAVGVADVAAAEAEGGKSHERDQDHEHNKSFLNRPILVVSNRCFASRWIFGDDIGANGWCCC